MVGKAKAPTKDEKERMTILKENVPCIPCLVGARKVRLPSIQHVVTGFKREGHDMTYTACNWHHFGDPAPADKQTTSGLLGPSLAHGKKNYQQFFGHEKLLVRIADFLVDEFKKSPWIDYNVPHDLRRRSFQYWSSKQ